MIKDAVGGVISLMLAFIFLCFMPLYYTGVIQWARSESEALAATRNLIDEVIDTRQLLNDTLADYNLTIAGLPDYYTTTITRQVKIINPDPLNAGQTYTTYVTVDDNSVYDQGDFIIVEVEPFGMNVFRTMARGLFGLSIPNDGFTLAGRVR